MKVCFIGLCGHSGSVYETMQHHPEISVCGVAPGSALEKIKPQQMSSIPHFSDYQTMLDEVQPDLAVISPIFALTGRIIIECAHRGISMIAEKPVASSMDELKEVRQAVLSSGVRFTAMHFLRYHPAFYEAGCLVHEGAIGDVRMVTGQKSYRFGTRPEWYNDRALYGGTIPWVGIHAIDWLSWFSQKKFLKVRSLDYGKPEMAALCQFQMSDGVLAAINVDYYRPQTAPTHGDDRVRVAGTEGVIEVMNGAVHLINAKGDRTWTPQTCPDLTEVFLSGADPIPVEEIFHMTAAAITARDAADQGIELPILALG